VAKENVPSLCFNEKLFGVEILHGDYCKATVVGWLNLIPDGYTVHYLIRRDSN
jgi:hypothetical protein